MRHVDRPISAAWFVLTFCGLLPATVLAEGPATQPASNEGKVLLLPFVASNRQDAQPWLGRSIQQSLLADLTMAAPQRATSGDTDAADPQAALDAGRRAGAQYVVFGNFATIGRDMRITGAVLDVSSGRNLGGLKATGGAEDVFRLEDQIAKQIKMRLFAAPSTDTAPDAGESTVPMPGALRIDPGPSAPSGSYYDYALRDIASEYPTQYNTYYYTTPSGGYDYGYPYWGYGYGWGYPLIISSGGHFHCGFHNRGDFHSRFQSGYYAGGVSIVPRHVGSNPNRFPAAGTPGGAPVRGGGMGGHAGGGARSGGGHR